MPAALYHFPDDLEQIISRKATEGADDLAALAGELRTLSDIFVGKAPWDSRIHRDPRLRSAYLAYFVPVNAPKVRAPLGAWLRARPERWAGKRLRCLDLGSGPGSALLGLCDFIRDLEPSARPAELDLSATDLSPENLRDAVDLLQRFAAIDARLPPIRVQTLRTDLVADRSDLLPIATTGGRFDLVLGANVVCELARDGNEDRSGALVEAIARDGLALGGAIVLIEPALKEVSRSFHRLRDRLLAFDPSKRRLYVHGPCLHQAACPALSTTRDWCYAEMPWRPPALVAELDRLTGLRKSVLKFSYLLLSTEPPEPRPATEWRLVSEVLDLKGERRFYLCADGRWILVSQLRRDRGPNDAVVEQLRRGDLVEVSGLEPRGALFRLGPNATIHRMDETPRGPHE